MITNHNYQTIKDMRRQVVDLNESLFHDRGMSWRVGSEPIVNVVGSGRNSSVYENWNVCFYYYHIILYFNFGF